MATKAESTRASMGQKIFKLQMPIQIGLDMFNKATVNFNSIFAHTRSTNSPSSISISLKIGYFQLVNHNDQKKKKLVILLNLMANHQASDQKCSRGKTHFKCQHETNHTIHKTKKNRKKDTILLYLSRTLYSHSQLTSSRNLSLSSPT